MRSSVSEPSILAAGRKLFQARQGEVPLDRSSLKNRQRDACSATARNAPYWARTTLGYDTLVKRRHALGLVHHPVQFGVTPRG